MIEAIFEAIFGFIIELIIELVGEAFIELGFNSTAEKLSSRTSNRLLAAGAYAIFGAVLGYLSLLVVPKIAFAGFALPVLYFLVSPVIAGFSLTFVSWLIRRGIRQTSWFSLDKFIFGVVFAITYSVARVILG